MVIIANNYFSKVNLKTPYTYYCSQIEILFPLSKINIIQDELPTTEERLQQLVRMIEFKAQMQSYIVSDLPNNSYLKWDDLLNIQKKKVAILDLKQYFSLTPNQLLNLINILKIAEKIIIMTSKYLSDDLLELITSYQKKKVLEEVNLIELNYPIYSIQEQIFHDWDLSFQNRTYQILYSIKILLKEEKDILIYCENLSQVDQIQEILQQQSNIQTHLLLPNKAYYQKYLKEIVKLLYPAKESAAHNVILTLCSDDLNQLENFKITLIIHSAPYQEIATYSQAYSAQLIRKRCLTRRQIKMRELFRFRYIPCRSLYIFPENVYLRFQNQQILDKMSFKQDLTVFWMRVQHYQLQKEIKKIFKNQKLSQEVIKFESQSNIQSHIPYYLKTPLSRIPPDFLKHFVFILSVLGTAGELLKLPLVVKNPFNQLASSYQQLRDVTLRSSPFWLKNGDCASWIQIIGKFSCYIQELLQQEETINSSEQLLKIQKWADGQHIVISKLVITMAYSEYVFTELLGEKMPVQGMSTLNMDLALIKQPSLRKQSSTTDYHNEFQHYLGIFFQNCQLRYTGNRKIGYERNNEKFLLYKESILGIIGDLPQQIAYLSFQEIQKGDIQILYCNKINASEIQKFSQSDLIEIVFQGVGQAIVNQLWRNDGEIVRKVESNFSCFFEPNLEINLITIFCGKNNEQMIKKAMDELLENLQKEVLDEIKEIPYVCNTQFIMKAGGILCNWEIKRQNEFTVVNLPKDIQEEDLLKLFEPYADIISIKIFQLNQVKKAEIIVEDEKDVQFIYEEFDGHELGGAVIRIIKKNIQSYKKEESGQINKLKFKWYISQNTGNALVTFYNSIDAQNVQKLLNKQNLDGRNLTVILKEDFTIQISNLSNETDEIDILNICGGKIKVKNIEIQRIVKRDINVDLQMLINKQIAQLNWEAQPGQQIYILESSKRKIGGKRVALVRFTEMGHMQRIAERLNGEIYRVGGISIKLHAYPQNSSIQVHCQIINNGKLNIKQIRIRKVNQGQDIRCKRVKSRQYISDLCLIIIPLDGIEIESAKIIIQSEVLSTFNTVKQNLINIFNGKELVLDQQLSFSTFTSPQGTQKIEELQQKMNIIIKLHLIEQKIIVFATDFQYIELQKEIGIFIKSNFQLTLSIPTHSIKSLIDDGQGLEQIRNKFNLSNVVFNIKQKELRLDGKQQDLDRAKEAILDMLSFGQQEQENNLNISTCTYCFDEMESSYLLQGCGHKFCIQCIMFSVRNSIVDINSLPMKCPQVRKQDKQFLQCNKPIVLQDLYVLLDDLNWAKLIQLAINQYVQNHNTEINYCLTPNCQFILKSDVRLYTCQLCNLSYCNQCKVGTQLSKIVRFVNILDKRAMSLKLEIPYFYKIRKCTNCKSLIYKDGGCGKVQCISCKKCLCWKNKANGQPCMLVFNTPDETYDHMNKIHGGIY